MITRATESGFSVSSWIGSTVGTPVRRGCSRVRVVGVLSFTAWLFSGKERACSRVYCRIRLCQLERWLWASRGGSWRDVLSALLCPVMLWLIRWTRLQKGVIGWVLAPYHASRYYHVRWERDRRIKCPGSRTCVRRRAASLRSRLVDSYEPVTVFDGCYLIEPQLIHTTLFPCSRLWASSLLDNRTCDRGASSRGPRFMYGCSYYVRRLGYPLLIPSTVLFENLAKTLE